MATTVDEATAVSGEVGVGEDKESTREFDGNYVPNSNGEVTVVLTFPAEAVDRYPQWRPIEALRSVATQIGLKGYGEGDTPQVTVGVERAKHKDPDTKELVDNPRAGQPNGNYSLRIHTPESLAEARTKRGRVGMTNSQQAVFKAISSKLKMALMKPGSQEKLEALNARHEAGEITLDELVQELDRLNS